MGGLVILVPVVVVVGVVVFHAAREVIIDNRRLENRSLPGAGNETPPPLSWCKSCGQILTPVGNFCPRCGAATRWDAEAENRS